VGIAGLLFPLRRNSDLDMVLIDAAKGAFVAEITGTCKKGFAQRRGT
jgi:hypothetical protein